MTWAAARPVLRVHPHDNVVVALRALAAGEAVAVDAGTVLARDDVPVGHKMAIAPLAKGETVVKYGYPIGRATADVDAGSWLHTHNVATTLERATRYHYQPLVPPLASTGPAPTFFGYRRSDGRVGTRNEVWVLNTVGCVNVAAERIVRAARERLAGRGDGVHTFSHPYGCSQLSDDLVRTREILAGLLRHPNAGGVLVLGLGCETNALDALLAAAGDIDRTRVRFFNTQEVDDEEAAGVAAVEELLRRMEADRREPCPASALIVGLKCGGSDAFSGITANPLLGRVADRLTAYGGGAVLTEVPEMFGAEQILMNRAADAHVFGQVVALVDGFKRYFARHGQPVYENPSPGNKEGGLTTLEEKSLGAIQKGGHAVVARVLRYGERAAAGGLSLLEAPGNDAVSATALVASGATLVLFTTGRGTPLGVPVPTVKVSSNSAIARKKPHWIDFDAGGLLDGTAEIDGLADALFAQALDIASGRLLTRNETHGYREIAIWKDGVTL
jgi:altronate hydrolase